MYSQDLESSVLELARARGLLAGASASDLDPAQLGDLDLLSRSSCFGPRLDRLLQKGLLDSKAVESLVWEVVLGSTSPASWSSAPVRPPSVTGEGSDADLDPTLSSRFLETQLVGEGASARVYKVFDPQLQRWVALKLLKTTQPAHREILLAEARAQAKVEHPNVCRVHEVGQVGERGYILMEFARGSTLAHGLDSLDLAAKVRLLRDVSEGIHAAHRQGLVHLDLKPGNILLQPSGEGGYRPLITDFGLVRPEAGQRFDGMLAPMGTPPYSSPEQITGRLELLDRRSDIYSLGVTLYVVLTGGPPFEVSDFSALVEAIQHKAPKSLRASAPELPRDLDAIVAMCLEKDPLKRYASAQALADELDRYLAGEPVEARMHSGFYRVGRWMRRHRLKVAVLVAALVAGSVFAALGLAAVYRVKTQARLAREFQTEADQIDLILRNARSMPFHDISPTVQQVKARMEAVRSRMIQEGPLAEGPGLYALGRAELTLGDPEIARNDLQRAWDKGFQVPEEAAALGEALVRAYQMRIVEYQSFKPTNSSDAVNLNEIPPGTLKQLRSTYTEPSKRFLELTRDSLTPARKLYLEGLENLADDLPAEAVSRARAVERMTPWSSEAWVLEAMGERSLAFLALYQRRYPEVRSHLGRMSEALDRATDLARSSPEVYDARIQNIWMRVALLLAVQQPVDAEERRAQNAVRDALSVNPEDWWAYAAQGALRLQRVGRMEQEGLDTRPVLMEMVNDTDSALKLNPKSTWALSLKGNALFTLGYTRHRYHGESDRASFEASIRVYHQLLELTPFRDQALCDLATSYSMLALHEVSIGDPRSESDLDAAIDCFQRSVALAPTGDNCYQLGTPFKWRGRRKAWKGQDPMPDYRRALDTLQQSLSYQPKSAYTWGHISDVQGLCAEWRLAQGQDPTSEIDAAIRASRRSIDLDPTIYIGHLNLGEALLLQARVKTSRGVDPTGDLHQAETELRAADRYHGADPEILCDQGLLECERLRWDLASGRPHGGSLRRGLFWVDRASRMSPLMARSRLIRAELLLLGSHGPRRDARDDQKRALAALDQAVAINPDIAWEAQRLLRDTR